MTQPTERRFVMEPRLDAEIQTINNALATKITNPAGEANIADNAITSAKIANGTIVNADINASAAIDKTKISGTAITAADTGTVTGTILADNSVTSAKIVNGTIVDADVNASAAIAATKISGTAVTQADTGTVTSAMIANGTIVDADVNASAAIAATKVQGTVPAGGGAGQVLAKSSTTDYATTWVDGTALPASQVKQLVKNMTGSAIPKGSVVYYSGADGTNILISLSDADTEATSSKTVGFTETAIANAGTGYVVSEGLISNVDTGSATAGQPVWLSSTAGGYVFGAPPAKPAHSVYLGLVTRANANTGEIFVKVQNGFELEELHNVSINSGTLATGQALTYDAATSLWKNSTPVNSLSGLSDVALSGPTTGQVLKYNGTSWANATGGSGGVTAQATAPSLSTASNGDAWFNTTDGTMYVCFVDVDATKQWVQVQANSALDASIQGRVGALESQAIAFGALSPNYIINGAFDIWQRGTSLSHSGGSYVVDRWRQYTDTGSGTNTRQTSFISGIGQYCHRFTSTAASTNFSIFQYVETANAINLAGKTVTLSAYLRASATLNMKLEVSYSTTVDAGWGVGTFTSLGSNTVSVTTTGARYSTTVTVPANAVSISVAISCPTNLTNGQWVESVGVQLEAGSTATSFRRNGENIQAELAACQRYYQVFGGGSEIFVSLGAASTTGQLTSYISPKVTMRATPTVTHGGAGNFINHCPGVSYVAISALAFNIAANSIEITSTNASTGAGAGVAGRLQPANSSGWVALSSEL